MVVELSGGICHTIDLCTLLLESECCYADPLVAAEVSQVKDRQEKLLLEKGRGYVEDLFRRCCKAVASEIEIGEGKLFYGHCLAGGLKHCIFIRRI